MTEGVAALPAQDLQGGDLDSGRDVHQALVGLHLLRQGVFMDRVGESGPGRMMFVLLCTEENVTLFFSGQLIMICTLRKEGCHICYTRTFPHRSCLYGSPV